MVRLFSAALRRRSTTFFLALLASLLAVNDGWTQTPDLRIQGTATVDEAAGSVTVPVYLDGVGGGTFPFTVTVQFTTVDNTATAPTDYTTTSGTLTFPPGTSRQYITVPIINNNVTGSNKDFYIQLSNAVNGSIIVPQCDVTIIEDAPPLPTVQFSASSCCISEYGGSATITATLNTSSSNTVTVNFATSAGTATPGTDYQDTSGTLTFPAGSTSQTFSVTVMPNLLGSGDKTVTLTLSSPSGATLGTPNPATLNIWDCPPVFTVTAASNPICAGALQTPIHQSVINVSLTNEYGGIANIPLTLATTVGSLDATSGVTDSSGAFAATLTSNHKASGPKAPYRATITVVANGQLTQKVKVKFDPTTVALTSDVTKIPPGGVANLTATLTFQGQAVAGHNLHWSIAAIWDHTGTQIYSGSGTVPSGYGHIESGASATSDVNGDGTAVYKGGGKKGKVEVKVSDTSVEKRTQWTNPFGLVSLPEDGIELKIQVIVDGKQEDLNARNRRFLVGEQVNLVIKSNLNITEYKWSAAGNVFETYTSEAGGAIDKTGKFVVNGNQPKGKYNPVAANVKQFKVCWFGTDEGAKAVVCKVKVNNEKDWFKEEAKNEVEIFRPTAQMSPEFGKMVLLAQPAEEKDKKLVAVRWFLVLLNGKDPPGDPGLKIDAAAKMPAPFADAKNVWTFVNLVRPGRTLYNEAGKTASLHSIFGKKKTLNETWVLDGIFPYLGNQYKIDPNGKLVNVDVKKVNSFLDSPNQQWITNLNVPGDPEKGVKPFNIDKFGDVEKVEFKNEEFKTFLMFQSQRAGLTTFAVPITVYSGWTIDGLAAYNGKAKVYMPARLNQIAGKVVSPSVFSPEWNDNVLLGQLALD